MITYQHRKLFVPKETSPEVKIYLSTSCNIYAQSKNYSVGAIMSKAMPSTPRCILRSLNYLQEFTRVRNTITLLIFSLPPTSETESSLSRVFFFAEKLKAPSTMTQQQHNVQILYSKRKTFSRKNSLWLHNFRDVFPSTLGIREITRSAFKVLLVIKTFRFVARLNYLLFFSSQSTLNRLIL